MTVFLLLLIVIKSAVYVLVSWFIGKRILQALNCHLLFWVNTFISLLISQLTIVFLFTVYSTGFQSLMVFLPLPFLVYYFLQKRKRTVVKEHYVKSRGKLSAFIFFVVILVFNLFRINNPIIGLEYEMTSDLAFYAKAANYIGYSGVENIYLNFFQFNDIHPVLYHYGDLWHISAIQHILIIDPINAQLISWSVLWFIIWLGAVSIIESMVSKIKRKHLFIALGIFIVSGISFYIPTNTWLTKGDWWEQTILFYPKLNWVIILLIVLLLIIIKKAWNVLVTPILVIAILYLPVAPGLFIGMTVGLIFMLSLGVINKKNFFIQLFFLLFTTFLIAGFYWITAVKGNASSVNYTDYYSSPLAIKTAINILGSISIKMFLALFPFGILLLLIKQKLKNPLVVIPVFLVAGGGVAWALFHLMFDSVQLWGMIYIAITIVFIYYLLVYTFINIRNLRWYIVILIGLLFYQNISDLKSGFRQINKTFYKKVLSQIDTIDIDNKFVFFLPPSEIKNSFNKNVIVYTPLNYLIGKVKNYQPLCLSVFDIPIDTNNIYVREMEESIIWRTPFYQYAIEKWKTNPNLDIETLQLQFIEDYNVEYLIFKDEKQIPVSIKSKIMKVIIPENSEGYKFAVLNIINS